MCRGEKITKKKVEKKRRRRNIVSLYTNERTKLALLGFVPLSLNKRDKIVHMGSCNMQITKREGRKKKVDEKKKREKGKEKHRTGRFFYSIATPLIVGKTGRGANGRAGCSKKFD